MKLVIVLCVMSLLQAHARGYSQNISLRLQNASLEKAITEIEKQSGYHFIYAIAELEKTKPINIDVKRMELATVLAICFAEQPVHYTIEARYIILKRKEEGSRKESKTDTLPAIRGMIANEKGEPIAGATIKVKGSTIATSSNTKGAFEFKNILPTAILIVTGAELETEETAISYRTFIPITVKTKINDLDQVLVMAYGETTKRLNTGNISKITAEEIGGQPVSNPLAAMQGRVPGLIITQSSGIPGSAFKIQIRGQNSIGTTTGLLPANNPLIIIDGVPFGPGNDNINQLVSAANNPRQVSFGGISAFNNLNPGDIESIEVLKDADATSIYGSRGANGVILITTKKGKAGKSKFDFNIYHGISTTGRTMELLDTREYLTMRKEAFTNDNAMPELWNAPDLLVWDTTRYTDWKDFLIGGTAQATNAQGTVSGGNENTRFLLSSAYYRQTTLFPSDFADTRNSFHLNVDHNTTDKRFRLKLAAIYSAEKNKSNVQDVTSFLTLAPVFPQLRDSSGNIKWAEKNVSFGSQTNPLVPLGRGYELTGQHLSGNLNLSYILLPGLEARTNLGYNTYHTDEVSLRPNATIEPGTALGVANFSTGSTKGWIIEPQLSYKRNVLQGGLTILAGATWQQTEAKSTTVTGNDYRNDALLRSISAAGRLTSVNTYSLYRYTSLFGRVTYNFKDRYIANYTLRRDGSSRFGPGKQFANFNAIGAAWLFSNTDFIKSKLPVLSFGKLRASYGTTGNDQIGNYQYLDTWSGTSNPYQGTTGLRPSGLFKPDYAWEINRKAEAGIELGLLKDKLLFFVSYFRNRCGNQLINMALPIQTGFSSIPAINFPALVQNTGIEFSIVTSNIKTVTINWTTSLNLTVPKNKLIAFPGLATSNYRNQLAVGHSLTVIKSLQYLGVDPQTGIYHFSDVNRDGELNSKDYVINGNRDTRYYGGINNSVSYKNWRFEVFAEFRKQRGANYLAVSSLLPGTIGNQPKLVLQRWQKPGDIAPVQRFTSSFGSDASFAFFNLNISDGIYTDASFVRLKNMSISYTLKKRMVSKLKMMEGRIYLQGQNLFTITGYKGTDPETQNIYMLPPLRTITAGIQLTF